MSDTIKCLRDSIHSLLPSDVCGFANRITDHEESFGYEEEARQMKHAGTKRRNEFIVGRRCARSALKQMGIQPCALVAGEDRVPQWPAGTVGSISHSVSLCCAVAARTSAIECLGIDLEMTTRISPGVIERVTHPAEVEFVNGDAALGSLIFSAKEAFFKAQFPKWGIWPAFRDVAFQVHPSSSQLTVVDVSDGLRTELRSAVPRMQFRYAFFDNYVLTLCWLEA